MQSEDDSVGASSWFFLGDHDSILCGFKRTQLKHVETSMFQS